MAQKKPLPPLSTEEIIRRITPYLGTIDATAYDKRSRAAQFRAMHKIGILLQRRQRYHGDVIKDVAKKIGRKPRWAYRIARFADLYNKNDLDKLCGLADKLNWGHLDRLLNIVEHKDRMDLQAEAAKEGWNNLELERIIRGRFQNRRAGGRKLQVSKSPEASLALLIYRNQRWLQYVRTVVMSGGTSVIELLETMFSETVAPELHKRLATALEDAEGLHEESGILLKRLQGIKRKANRARKASSSGK